VASIDGLEAVLAELRVFDPWTQAAFMLTPNTWLDDETPLDELRRGRATRVREAASVYGEHVAA
jgi:cephalosporin hydroxylase